MAMYATRVLFPNMYRLCVEMLKDNGKDVPAKIAMPGMLTYDAMSLAEEGLSKLTGTQITAIAEDSCEAMTLLHTHVGVSVAALVLELLYKEVR